jgi:hypothetical protein
MAETMTFREMNLRVFQGKPVPHVFFQPRFEPWFAWHRTFNLIPPAFKGMSIADLYDNLHVSMRYIHFYTGIPDPVLNRYSPRVKVEEKFEGRTGVRIYHTPYGDMTERLKLTIDEEWRVVEFAAKTVDDLKKLRWLYEQSEYSFSVENFNQGDAYMGDRGLPQFWLPKSPYQALAQIWMKLPDLIYALADAPAEVEAVMQVIDNAYDPLYTQIAASRRVQIINFGENIHEALFSPRYFERYLVPWWEKRSNQLRQAGIFTHVHIDGYFKSILKYLRHLPFDGLEALTPLPQGDVTLEEMKEHIGDKVLLDGIPAVLFMDTFSRDELMEMTEMIVELFSPRLVLGVSDEVPEGCDQEAIERVRLISQWCQNHGNLEDYD